MITQVDMSDHILLVKVILLETTLLEELLNHTQIIVIVCIHGYCGRGLTHMICR